MDTPTTALSRVEAVLQASETGLFLHQIAREADVTEKEAKAAVKELAARAQIELIPTPGRWGQRYAWLAAKNPLPEVAGPGERAAQVDKPESEVDKPESEVDKTPNLQSQTAAKPVQARMAVKGESGPELVETSNEYAKAFARLFGRIENPRYLVLVPKRKPRIVKSRARAEALALAAVRNGAKSAEVFSMAPLGRARRGAEWSETTS